MAAYYSSHLLGIAVNVDTALPKSKMKYFLILLEAYNKILSVNLHVEKPE